MNSRIARSAATITIIKQLRTLTRELIVKQNAIDFLQETSLK